jgi:hypothetical protein
VNSTSSSHLGRAALLSVITSNLPQYSTANRQLTMELLHTAEKTHGFAQRCGPSIDPSPSSSPEKSGTTRSCSSCQLFQDFPCNTGRGLRAQNEQNFSGENEDVKKNKHGDDPEARIRMWGSKRYIGLGWAADDEYDGPLGVVGLSPPQLRSLTTLEELNSRSDKTSLFTHPAI